MGERIFSPNQLYQVVVQKDSNVVLYNIATGAVPWATNTAKAGNVSLHMQADCHLVLYNVTAAGEHTPLWGTRTVVRQACQARHAD